MTTVVTLKPILDRKQWEMCNYAPSASGAGSFIVSSKLFDQYQYFFNTAATMYIYDPFADAWMLGPSPALAGTFGAGSCGARHPWGPRGFPTAGTTTTITTALNLQRSLTGYVIRIIAGPNAGTDAVIQSNTTGANSVITVVTPFGTPITTASEFIMLTGRVWVVNAGTVAVGSFRYYDTATNTWNSGSITNLPATIGTDARLCPTPGEFNIFKTLTATGGSATTIAVSTANWGVNTWANYQVRITAGTGAGQFRAITSNTATTLTVPAWTINPDATSVFVIEGNSDNLYFLGNAAVTMYRYSISANTWTVLSPGVARSGAPAAGVSAHWVAGVLDPDWSIDANYLNGQYIYSFRGNAVTLDRYNICTNAWDNDIAYTPKADSVGATPSWVYAENYIYCFLPTGRVFKYNVPQARVEPCAQLWYAQGVAVVGDRAFDVTYTDGGTNLRWLYFMGHTQTNLFRTLLF